MVVQALKLKNHSYYFWNDIIFIEDFDPQLLKLVRRESRVNIDIYYIGYITRKTEYDIRCVNPLYLMIRSLVGYIKKINGSDDRNIVISDIDSNKKVVINTFNELRKDVKDKIDASRKDYDEIKFGSNSIWLVNTSIEDYHKIRFSSDIDLPLNSLIKFHALTIVINCVIEKNSKYYPEIYLDDALFENDKV